MKRQATDWETIFTNSTSKNGLVSTIYKELSKLNNKTAQLKINLSKDLTDTSPKKIHEWRISTKKDA